MYDLCNILKHVVYSLNDVSLSEHHLVVERHELVLHVRPESCNQMYAILKQEIKQLLGDVPLSANNLPYKRLASTLNTSGSLSLTLAPVSTNDIISHDHCIQDAV